MAAIADQDFFGSGYGILLHPGLQRLGRTKKSFQEKGIGMGKTIREKIAAFLARIWGGKESVFYINGPENLPAPLTREEEAQVFQRLPEDAEARETLIVHNLRLVVYIARKFESTGHRCGGFDFHWNHRLDQGGEYFLSGSEYQAGDLCLPMYRKRDFDVFAKNAVSEK